MMHATPTCHRGLRYGFIPRREQDLLESIRIAWHMGSCHVLLCRHAALLSPSIPWGIIMQLNNPFCSLSSVLSHLWHVMHTHMEEKCRIQIKCALTTFIHYFLTHLKINICKNSNLRDIKAISRKLKQGAQNICVRW